jgi:hypothetical protein
MGTVEQTILLILLAYAALMLHTITRQLDRLNLQVFDFMRSQAPGRDEL